MNKPRTCERCKEPLVDDEAGYSSDGRLICTRFGCQYVEEVNRRVDEGTLVLADTEEFRTEIKFPTSPPAPPGAFSKNVAQHHMDHSLRAIYLRPLPQDKKEDDKHDPQGA